MFGGRLLRQGDRIGPYVFDREVGSGGMARVLLSRDPGGLPVALKILRANRFDNGLARFRREFHALSRLSHPNIVSVHAYGDFHGHPYIAMELVDGPDLHTVIRSLRHAEDAARYARAEDILSQLCRALSHIHRRGLVHRDLKPSNVLLSKEGVCKLTDFGIVKDLDPGNNPQLSTTLVGTWAYTSPEHIMGLAVDHRSDLYSLGVILFALLTGKRPFVADNMAGYLEMHRDRAAPRASTVRPGVPEHLDEICARLLAKAPRDRFQSAQEILHRLEADDSAPDAQSPRAWEPPLVGNPDARIVLEEAVHGLTAGRGGVVRVLGEDGAGKSRWLQLVVDQARSLGIDLHHHAFHPDTPVFTVAMRIARELLREVPETEETGLGRIVQVWSEGIAVQGDTRYALYDALREALQLALQDRPRVIALDDLHEAMPQEIDLLSYLARSLIDGAGLPLLIVSTGRKHGTQDAGGEVRAKELRLQPLRLADVRLLVASLIGPGRAADMLADRLHRDTDGNAFFATEFLRSLISRHLIARTTDGWKLVLDAEDLARGHIEIPPGIRQMLKKRIDVLPPSDRAVVEVMALSGLPLMLEVLHAALGLPEEEDLLQRLDRLIEAEMVLEHRRGDELSFELVHRALAELLVSQISEARRQAIHRAIAMAMEELALHDPEALEVIGEHFLKAGDAGRAYEHLVIAAGRLVERSMPEAAWDLSEKATAVELAAHAELSPPVWSELRMEHLRVRVHSLQNRGAWDDAATAGQELLAVAEEAGDDRAVCRARLELARIFRQRGQQDAARDEAETALKLARRMHFRQGVAAALHNLAALSWMDSDLDRCEQLTHEGLLVAQGAPMASERARLLLTYALSIGLRGQLSAAIRNMSEAEGLFRDLRMQPQRVLALANLAELQGWQGDVEEAWSRADEALTLADQIGYRLGRTVALRARGVAALELGRGVEAQADLRAAAKVATAIEVHEEKLASEVALVRLCLQSGDEHGALRHGARALEAAGSRDTEQYLPLLHALLARAMAVQRPRVAASLLRAAVDALPSLRVARRLQVHMGIAWAALALGDRAGGIDHAERLLRDRATRAFRGLQIEARNLLAGATTGEIAQRHRRIGAELASDDTDTAPVTGAAEDEAPRATAFGDLPDETGL